ncbi:phenylalanine--tRNA ligase subunit beta-related protein [Amycolatopsis silviterrae]|uniref:phenylalanine--tRNA ligase n=1 Tax=Amycolatopsis silviterrae TaxID=1656914 RepID=A0ABW5HJN6_9PSEU
MKISLEWLTDYVPLPGYSPDRLAHDLTLKTVEVEGYDTVDGDVVFEIDNKSLTNRPDLWGHYGIAREFSVLYGLPLTPLPRAPRPPRATGLIRSADPDWHQRILAIQCTVDSTVPVPAFVRDRLRRIGAPSRDLSAYVMYAVGQPSDLRTAGESLVLEIPTLIPSRARRSARTEASVRQEKGLDTQRADQAADLFLHLLTEADPSAVAIGEEDLVLSATHRAEIETSLAEIERRIGLRLPEAEILRTLRALGCTAEITGDLLRVVAPSWRSTGDLALPVDIAEELARIHGFDALPARRPVVELAPRPNRLPLSRQVRETLAARGGATEVLTYPWSADHLLAACGLDATLTIAHPPAPDRARLRPSLVPNLLEAAAANLRYYDEFSLFEVGTVFTATERTSAGILLAGPDGIALFRRAKGLAELLRRHCHLTALDLSGTPDLTWADESARLAIHDGSRPVGALALVRPSILRAAGIDRGAVACVELDLDALRTHPSRENRYDPVSDLPESDFDLSVVAADTVRWAQVADTAAQAHPLVRRVTYVDDYRGAPIPPEHRSLTLRVTLRPQSATLTTGEIAAARSEVLAALERAGARLR